jgi:hypothetical protein
LTRQTLVTVYYGRKVGATFARQNLLGDTQPKAYDRFDILGASLIHERPDTKLGYARLYDGTVAADYCRAMAQVEARMALQEGAEDTAPNSGQLLAPVDALSTGTPNDQQRETVQAPRAGILTLAEQRAEVVRQSTCNSAVTPRGDGSLSRALPRGGRPEAGRSLPFSVPLPTR